LSPPPCSKWVLQLWRQHALLLGEDLLNPGATSGRHRVLALGRINMDKYGEIHS
jgi:hypothetical protein